MSEKAKTVLVFGTFDGLHDGHRFFLREARELGHQLVVSVAQDSVVEKLKGRPPHKPFAERLADLRASGLVDEAVGGDQELGSWSVVKKSEPEIIALGYDQTELEQALRTYSKKKNLSIQFLKISAHEPERYHTSLLP